MAALKHNGTEIARVTVDLGPKPERDLAGLERRYSFRSNRRILVQTSRVWAENLGGDRVTTGWTRWARMKEGTDMLALAERFAADYRGHAGTKNVTLVAP